MSLETRAKISAEHMGHAVSLETREKMSANMSVILLGNTRCLGNHASPETRAKMSLSAGKGPLHWRWKGGLAVWQRKQSAKRRLLGFNPLNSWFPGCDAHHINNDDVIYVPHDLHSSIRHNQYTGKGMAAMNALAGAFLTEDWT